MKNRPVTFNEENISSDFATTESLLAEAQRLRSEALAGLFAGLWNAPGALLRRAGPRRAASAADALPAIGGTIRSANA